MEELEFYILEAEDQMKKSVKHAGIELSKVRAGKAMPNILEGIMVEYYGATTPISQMATISTPDARTIFVKPWEKTVIPDIEKAIVNSDLGLNPQNDGEQVIINIPALTEERRQTLVKQVKHECELAKISLRNIRKDANDHLKQLQKEGASEDEIRRAEDKIQTLTNDFSKQIDDMTNKKEQEIMTV